MGTRLLGMILVSAILVAALVIVIGPHQFSFHVPILAQEPERPDICANVTELVPEDWVVEWTQPENTDDDPEPECIVIYRYDQARGGFGGPVGALVYDRQPDRRPGALDLREPYRPAAFIPYLLTPRQGGKGYLGERPGNGVAWADMVQVYDVEGDGQVEVVLQGYSGYTQFPTTLSIFEWLDPEQGYRLMTNRSGEILWGDGGIEIMREYTEQPDGTISQGQIHRVLVRQRLYEPYYYARSQLCHETVYTWDSTGATLHRLDQRGGLVFCFGRPIDPDNPDNELYSPRQNTYRVWYPEEALLTYYPDRQVVGIVLAGSGEGDSLEAIAQVKDFSGQMINENWRLTRLTSSNVGEMTAWKLDRLPDP